MAVREFVFGSLPSDEARLAHQRALGRGVRHLSCTRPLAPGPGEPVEIRVTVGLAQAVAGLTCRLQTPQTAEIGLERRAVEWDTLSWGYRQEWRATLPGQPAGTLVRYTLAAETADGGRVPADDGAVFSYLVGDPAPPAWAAEAIIYQVFPDRFHPGRGRRWRRPKRPDGIYGGTLRGVIEQLDYIAGLGFNCLWLNPFFPDHTYHGYHASDYFKVNPRLGSLEDARELAAAAHERGLRLLLDFVANHWGSRHPTFQAARADPESEYRDWYHWRRWPDDYATFFDVRDLPQINVDHPAARAHLLEAAQFWLGEVGFDGCRLDYALGPSLDFWADFRRAATAARPDAWLFGEVIQTPETQLRYWGRLHGCLDFQLLVALRGLFAEGEMGLAAFDAFLDEHEAFFPAGFSRPSFLDNHDMNRFLWAAGGDARRLKLAALCQFTLAGPPIVYYGTEVGLSQPADVLRADGRHDHAQARLPMVWGEAQDADLRAFYAGLIGLRRQHSCLWRGRRETLHLDKAAQTYAYSRADERSRVVIGFNLGDRRQRFAAGGQTFELGPLAGEARALG